MCLGESGQGYVWKTEDDVAVNNPEMGWEDVCYTTKGKGQGENASMGI